MADIPNSIPSATEMLALAELLPPEKPPAPPTAQVLHHFVDLCRTKWIRDFLFTADPIHVRHFTSPTFTDTAFACHHSSTHVEAPSPRPAGILFGESRHTEGTLLFAPAFTVGCVSVGFGVMESLLTLGAPWLPEGRTSYPVRMNFRFVRDANGRVLFMMYDLPSRDIIVVHCSRLESTTRFHKFDVKLCRSKLLASIRRDDGYLSAEKLVTSLDFFCNEFQYRPCFMCGASAKALCGCFIPIDDPAHPFDTHYFTSGMLQYFGDFAGVLNKVFGADGRERGNVVLATRTTFRGISEPALVQKLKAWTLYDHVRGVQENVWPSPSLTSASRLPRVMSQQEKYTGAGDLYTAEIEDNLAGPIAKGPTELSSEYLSSVAVSAVDVNNAGLGAPLLTSAFPTAACLGTTVVSQLVSEADGNGHIDDTEPHNEGENHRISENVAAQTIEISEFEAQSNNRIVTEPEKGTSTGGPPENRTERTPGLENNDGELTITEELKDEIRMQRNRAAARRCNQRNKALREGLKLELETCHERVAELRAREVRLRKENLWLRSLLLDAQR